MSYINSITTQCFTLESDHQAIDYSNLSLVLSDSVLANNLHAYCYDLTTLT